MSLKIAARFYSFANNMSRLKRYVHIIILFKNGYYLHFFTKEVKMRTMGSKSSVVKTNDKRIK